LAGKMGICGAFWRETELMAGNYPFSRRHRGPARRFAHFCFIRSPRARLRKPGLAGWMKVQIRAKTGNRGRSWAEYRRPDVKNGVRGPSRGTVGDALTPEALWQNCSNLFVNLNNLFVGVPGLARESALSGQGNGAGFRLCNFVFCPN
jgi:hypothetical protein